MFAAIIARQASRISRSRICRQSMRSKTRMPQKFARPRSFDENFEKPEKFCFEQSLRNDIVKQPVVDWDKVHNESFLELKKNPYNDFQGSFHAAVFSALKEDEDYDHLRQFVEHVGLENLAAINVSKYMRLCQEPDEILRCWEHLKSKHPILTERQVGLISEGLLRTPKWRESVKLLNDGMITSRPKLAAQIAGKYLAEQCFEEGINLLDRINASPWIGDYAEPVMENSEVAERFLTHMTSKEACIGTGYDPSKSESWNKHFLVKPANVSKRICKECKFVLPPGKLSVEEFEKLRDATLTQVMHQGDIYQGSSPVEFEKFQRYIKENGPFDAVIDGLNLLYRFEAPGPTIKAACQAYKDRECDRILILSRRHAKKLFEQMNLPRGVHLYCVSDSSEDDPYILLGALMSHPDCRMLTMDFFRNHMYKLKKISKYQKGEDIHGIFLKWFLTRKDACVNNSFRAKVAKQVLRIAAQNFLVPHQDPHGWHFPAAFSPGDPPHWFCIRRRKADLFSE